VSHALRVEHRFDAAPEEVFRSPAFSAALAANTLDLAGAREA
jgi:hypothetical protein